MKEEEGKQTKVNRGSREPPGKYQPEALRSRRGAEQVPSQQYSAGKGHFRRFIYSTDIFLEGRITSVSTVADALEVKVSIITSEYSVWKSRGCFPFMPRGGVSESFYF